MIPRIWLLFFFLSLAWCLPAHANGVLGNPVPVTQTAAAESSHVFKAAAGTLYSISVSPSTTAGYLMLFDATSIPADGAVTPVFCADVPGSTNWNETFDWPFPFQNGIIAVFSTTGCLSKTASNAFFAAQIR